MKSTHSCQICEDIFTAAEDYPYDICPECQEEMLTQSEALDEFGQ